MNSNSSANVSGTSTESRLSNPAYAINAPLAVTAVLFIVGAFLGGEVTDRELLPLVRFLSLVLLALGLYTAYMTGRYFSYSKKRWTGGQISSGFTGLGAGLLWSGAAFGAGFGFIMLGGVMGALLIAKMLQERAQRRRAAIQANAVATESSN